MIISYDVHSPCVEQMLNSCATQTRIILQTGKIWLEQYWKVVLCNNGEHGRQRKLGPHNNEIRLETLIFPKIRC